MVSKTDFLIVEDSPAIGLLLKNYLEKLDFTDIHTCDSGAAALSTFKELVANGKQPIVLLDFMLPDMDARSILTQMLEITPDVRVILETATDEDDPGVEELVRLGIYHYIQKPIRFENLKKIVETMEQEQSFFVKETPQSELLRQADEEKKEKIDEQLNFILKSATQITVNRISDLLELSNDFVVDILKKLEQEGKITPLGNKKEIGCSQCDSVKTSQIFSCPNCKSSDFKLGKLIEHYDCGNISEENTYHDDACPNCNKEIKALGVDYRVMKNHYICNNCGEFSPELAIHYLCLKCENKFELEDAKWKSSTNYKIINM